MGSDEFEAQLEPVNRPRAPPPLLRLVLFSVSERDSCLPINTTMKLALALFTVLLFAPFVALHAAETTAPMANVLFVVIDNADDEHFGKGYGGAGLTPHMDRIAARGVTFTRAHATTSLCLPSRYTCLSGRYPSRHGGPSDAAEPEEDEEPGTHGELEAGLPNQPKVMRAAGYATGFVGKYHLEAERDPRFSGEGVSVFHAEADAWLKEGNAWLVGRIRQRAGCDFVFNAQDFRSSQLRGVDFEDAEHNKGAGVLGAPQRREGQTRGCAAMRAEFPKAVHYRYANNFKVKPGQEDAAYREWLANFGRAMGAQLDGRVTVTDDGRREVIHRFKREHPEQFLIFYSTGHIKLPTEQTDPASGKLSDYSHGHWLYLPRVKVLHEIRAEAGVSELRVRMPQRTARGPATIRNQDEDVAAAKTRAAFSLRADRGDDICLYSLGPDDAPDWENAEQVRLVGLDEAQGLIRVQRGCYGTPPRAFTGQVFAAVHSEVTKFHGWFYNFSTFCPKDRHGRTAGDVWAEAYARVFQPGGSSAHFDALQLDTLVEDVWPGRGADINNNGIDDSEEDLGGANWFAVGVCRTLEKLRSLLPEEKLLLPDAGNRGFAFVNGWEVEGFPGRHDPAWRQYSEVCNRLELSRHLCREPRYTHVQHKIFNYTLSRGGAPQILAGKELPFHLSRAVMGLATIHEAAVTWYSQPPPEPDGCAGVYDEMRMGVANRLGWLGKPRGEIVYPGCATPDLCAGSMTLPWTVAGGKDGRDVQAGGAHARFRLSVTSPGPELLVVTRWRGEPRAGVGSKMPRKAAVSLRGGASGGANLLPADTALLEAGLRFPDGTTQRLPEPPARLEFYEGWHTLRLGARHDSATHLFWQTRRRVAAGDRLALAVFTGSGAYSVEAAAVRGDGAAGEFRHIVTPFTPIGPAVFQRNVALDPLGFGGKEVVFRFLAAMPKGRANAAWCEVALGRPVLGDWPPAGPIQRSIGGFVPEQSCRQTFHFNHVPAHVPLELAFDFEGSEPVVIEELSVHAASGAVAREFEHGVVLVNPSLNDQTFELARWFPGRSFRRFQATANQDTTVNNGQPVGATVILGGRDGLFLANEHIVTALPACGEIP